MSAKKKATTPQKKATARASKAASTRGAKSATRAPKAKAKAKARPAKQAFATFDAALFDKLLDHAMRVREHAYAPFSGYRVGAAVATETGTIHVGCNVENSTLGATICAERGAVMQMIAAGQTKPVACVVVTADGAAPCGICRQVLAEFAEDMPIVLASLDDESGRVVQLSELLPLAFRMAT